MFWVLKRPISHILKKCETGLLKLCETGLLSTQNICFAQLDGSFKHPENMFW